MLQRINKKDLIELSAVLGALFLISWVILLTDLDLVLQEKLFDQDEGWIYTDTFIWSLLYDHGPKPGLALGIGAFLIFLLSFPVRALMKFRKKTLFLALVLIFGTGIMVEAFKGATGRPRPRHIEFFQGSKEFVPVFSVKKPGDGESPSAGQMAIIMTKRFIESKGSYSFPSGHAAIAFYLMVPFFILRDRRRKLAVLCLAGGVSYGLLMGYARMAQGGHFLSDIIWAGGVVYLTCWFFYHVLDVREPSAEGGAQREERRKEKDEIRGLLPP